MLTKSYRDSLLESLQDPAEAAAYLDAALEDEDSGNSLLLRATDASAILAAINLTTVAAWTDKKEYAASRCSTKTLTESL